MPIRRWDEYQIKPVIPNRGVWKDDSTRRVSRLANVVYNEGGEVFCYPRRGAPKKMAYGGFEQDRDTLQ